MEIYTSPGAFLDRAQTFLESRELINGMILGVTVRMRERPDWMDSQPYLAMVNADNGEPLLAAIMDPPNRELLVTAFPDVPQDALDQLAENLRSGGWEVPGINAENSLAQRFAETWTRLTGQPHQIKMRLRAYELRRVIPPPHPPAGFLRLAAPGDLGTVTQWRAEFTRESLREEPEPNIQELVTRQIQSGNVYLWDNHSPVCMAVSTRPTRTGIWVGGVYTPPNLRGQGYASACVAALSQTLLDSGKAFCALFTDLDNSTSNSIYQKIGYQPVGDFMVFRFH
jgi:predicted GNAT family acetyltransferase